VRHTSKTETLDKKGSGVPHLRGNRYSYIIETKPHQTENCYSVFLSQNRELESGLPKEPVDSDAARRSDSKQAIPKAVSLILKSLALSLKLCYMGQNHEEKPSRQGFAVISS
jgi:hypothetical protein